MEGISIDLPCRQYSFAESQSQPYQRGQKGKCSSETKYKRTCLISDTQLVVSLEEQKGSILVLHHALPTTSGQLITQSEGQSEALSFDNGLRAHSYVQNQNKLDLWDLWDLKVCFIETNLT